MLVFLIAIGIICFVLFIFLLFSLSSIEIDIAKFDVDMNNEYCVKPQVTIKNYLIFVNIYAFEKIRIFKIKINEEKVKKMEKSKFIKWIDKKINMKLEEEIKDVSKFVLENRKKIFRKETIEYIKKLEMKLSKLKISITLGAEDAIITSYLVALIASGIAGVIAYVTKQINSKKYNYKVTPVYINQNYFKMELNCIINIKMVHIMNIIYLLLKKRSEKYDRASNRRPYGYSYGQHSRHG